MSRGPNICSGLLFHFKAISVVDTDNVAWKVTQVILRYKFLICWQF